ncbi:MAG: alpha-amylase family glycosyl hydrolase [Christensenella sp.]|nr:alpha-amylase family glycosyl hydrolase [Christensenella sp.]
MRKKRILRLFSILLVFSLLAAQAGCSRLSAGDSKTPDDNYRTFYEIFVGSFYDSNGDGTGDLNGVTAKLDYLNDGNDKTDSDLGFTGIWLMPIMPSPTYHKYDVTDYTSVDPAYGTTEDFRALAEACHARGMKLIIDFVMNHTSAKHPWFQQAVAYYESLAPNQEPDLAACPYAGYYHFLREKAGATGWHKAGASEWYYECVFWDQMPDLALENEAVRQELESAARFWLDLGADGFRLDAVKEFFSGSHAKNIETLAWFNTFVLSVDSNAILVCEDWDTNPVTLAKYYQSGVRSFFDFPVAQASGSMFAVIKSGSGEKLAAFFTRPRETYGAVLADYIDAPFLSNHDTSRISAQYVNNAEKMKLAAGLLLMMDGNPFVYYGEELGMNSSGKKDENKRLPMHWSDTDLTGTPNPPPNADKVTQKFPALDEQQSDPNSIYNYYKAALRIRNNNPALARGETKAETSLTEDSVCAITKTWDNQTILILCNIGERTAQVDLSGTTFQKYRLTGALTVGEEAVNLSDKILKLPMYAIAVLRLSGGIFG